MRNVENPELIKVTRMLKSKSREFDAPVWMALAKMLERSKHRRCAVNLSQINKYTEDGETVTVPGKVLGVGTLNHKVSVTAFSFSKITRKKIEVAGGECLTFPDLIEKNPKGAKVRIIG
jgi:large subunit ribosomal protein L18e